MSMKLHRLQAVFAVVLTLAGAGLAVRASATGPRKAQAPAAAPKRPVSPPAKVDRQARALNESSNKMRNIALAFHEYHSSNDRFPGAATISPEGKPLLSWRVELLPYLKEKALYEAFKKDESWDSPHNLALLPRMPRFFAHSLDPSEAPTTTHFQLFVGDTTPFRPDVTGVSSTAIVDGAGQTFLAVETAEAVPWTKPGGIAYSPEEPLPNLGVFYARRWPAVMLDGSVIFVIPGAPEEMIRRAITRSEGVPLVVDVLQAAEPAQPKAATTTR